MAEYDLTIGEYANQQIFKDWRGQLPDGREVIIGTLIKYNSGKMELKDALFRDGTVADVVISPAGEVKVHHEKGISAPENPFQTSELLHR